MHACCSLGVYLCMSDACVMPLYLEQLIGCCQFTGNSWSLTGEAIASVSLRHNALAGLTWCQISVLNRNTVDIGAHNWNSTCYRPWTTLHILLDPALCLHHNARLHQHLNGHLPPPHSKGLSLSLTPSLGLISLSSLLGSTCLYQPLTSHASVMFLQRFTVIRLCRLYNSACKLVLVIRCSWLRLMSDQHIHMKFRFSSGCMNAKISCGDQK